MSWVGLVTLLPLRRKTCHWFLSPLKIHRSQLGLNQWTLGPVAIIVNTTPLSVVDIGWCFRGTNCFCHWSYESFIILMLEAVSFSETSVRIYQTTWCYIPEDSYLHSRHHENVKSQLWMYWITVDGNCNLLFSAHNNHLCGLLDMSK
jgi:hypothetical protein